MKTDWLSVHLFHADPQQVLNEVVIPFLQERPTLPAFFIRYGEGGPHIRLRCKTTKQDMALYDLPGMAIRYVDYEPEITRYGNIPLAEKQFMISSRYVLNQLISNPLMQAIKMNLAIAYAIRGNSHFFFEVCDQFIASWLPRHMDQKDYLALAEKRFEQHAEQLYPATLELWRSFANGHLQSFITDNEEVYQGYLQSGFDRDQLKNIWGSFFHMGHNRIGVTNFDEAYVMYFTLKCRQHIYDQTGT